MVGGAGNLTQITDPDNYTLGFDYDAVNRWTKAYDKAGHHVSRKLDAAGRVKSVTDPNGNSTLYSYWNASQDGRLKSVTQPKIDSYTLGQIRQFDYDALGQVIKTTDTPAAGSTESVRDTLKRYDALGRLIRVAGPAYVDQNPSSATFNQTIRPVTRYVYNNLGHLTEIKAGQTTADGGTAINADSGVSASDTVTTQVSYVNDDFGRKLSETDANNQVTTYTYDLNNNVKTRQTPGSSGHTLTYVWDYGHQLLSVTAEDGRKIEYDRNPLGQTIRAETWSPAPGSQLEAASDYGYDAGHRLATVNDNRGHLTLSYAWSPGGQLDSLTDNDGRRTDYLYDEVGRLTSLWAPNYDHYTFDYDNGGRLVEARYPNGISQTLVWNADNSLNKIAHKNAATVIAQSQYSYDGLGRRKTNQETLSGQATLSYTYSYDALDRLTQVQNGTLAQTQSFGHDVYGNRVQKQIGNPATATTAYRHNAGQQLTEVRQTDLNGTLLEAYLYDDAGNQSKKCSGTAVTRTSDTACAGSSQSQYQYDSLSQLNQIQVNGATIAGYQYDDQGRRIRKSEGATVTNYHYDGNSIYAEYPSGNWTTANAVYVQAGTDHPLARLTGNINLPTATAQYYHQDGLGSVLATTNAAKAVTATQRFDAYGAKIGGTGTIPQYGYTGREPDASGLIYYRARYYDPNQVRFTQRDPLGYIDGLNRYSYVHNNPINFNDPNGLLANRVLTWADTQTTSYVNARSDLYADIGNQIATSYNNGVGQLPASISTPIQGFISGSQGQVNSTPSIANFLGNQARTGFYNVLDSVAPKIPGTDVRFAFGLGTKDVLMQNKANGATWETQVINNILPQTQTNIQPQISVKSNGPSGLKVRLDALGTSIDNGATMLSEMKSSPTAPLTPNQAIVFPELESYGGVVVGNGKTPYVGGTPIPPSVVNIFRKP
ncbi:RHS repeat-associated core domain-containing protein [Methylomonas sp. HW2-6]|uniref:RHS repeat-associated core domain-containing protein n=1 Tax=Methylomonas sp. HW2-6 TaxID=3376687 RepID=UPI004040FA8C